MLRTDSCNGFTHRGTAGAVVGAIPAVPVEEDLVRRLVALETHRVQRPHAGPRPDHEARIEAFDFDPLRKEVQLGLWTGWHGNVIGDRRVVRPEPSASSRPRK